MKERKETIMLPLSEVLTVKWSAQRRNNLRSLRGQISLMDLAKRVNDLGVTISRPYLHRLENDPEVKGISAELLQAIAQALDISIGDLLGLEEKNFSIFLDTCN
jgi:DNA-binding Xre family transcriptional regulator